MFNLTLISVKITESIYRNPIHSSLRIHFSGPFESKLGYDAPLPLNTSACISYVKG